MGENSDEEMNQYLKRYQEIRSKKTADRNIAIWCLHAYFMKLLDLVIRNYFEIDVDSLVKNYSNLFDRWMLIKDSIELISRADSNIKRYHGKISRLREFTRDSRHRVEAPSLARMDEIFEDAIPFHEWLIKNGKKFTDYKKKSKLRDIDFYLARYSKGLLNDLEILQKELGEEPPFNFVTKEYYDQIPQNIIRLSKIWEKVKKINPLEESDIIFIIECLEKKEKIEAEKWTLVAMGRCPKCGSAIKKSQWYSSHPPDEPPDTVYWRVGCEKCDFELDSDSESI